VRKLLLACTAIALLPLVGQAQATPLTITVSADGGPAQTFVGTDTLTIVGQTFGVWNLNNISVFSAPNALTLPSVLDANTLDANTTTTDGITHTLAIDVVGSFTGATPGAKQVTSSFDTTGLTTGWNIKEITDVNGVNLSPGFSFTATALNHASALDQTDTVTIGSSFTASEHFLLTSNGTLGQANNGIQMSVPVTGAPGPVLGSALPGAVMASLFGGMFVWRRRKLELSLMP
jgi:hypothetical protein